ncbi:MAG: glycosyltransferase [Patescibacteria group bacterium]
MNNPIVSINIVVLNGEKYIRHCLESIFVQSYSHELIEINILDNGSTDNTIDFIENWKLKNENFKITFIKSNFNHGMWGGQEELLKQSSGKYIVILSVDVILEKDFISNAVRALDANPKLGALQAKIYQFNLRELEIENWKLKIGGTIDSCGFKIFRSRRIVNIGHGETDIGQYDKAREIFGVEGAVPVFKKEALESIRILGEIADHDLFWYAEDLDVAWRLRMAGWEQRYEPSVMAWHDRQTTKQTRRGLRDFIAVRRAIPLRKRQLEWRNIRCTIIKNDYIINTLKDLPYILLREITITVYLLIFETAVFAELPTLLKLIPRMFRKRREIMKRAKASLTEIHAYFF